MAPGPAHARPAGALAYRAGTDVSIRPRFVDEFSAMNAWQAYAAGTALVATGLLLCVWALYNTGQYLRCARSA